MVAALTAIRGIGRRIAFIICKLAKIDLSKRAGEITEETWETVGKILTEPVSYGIPSWFFNRRKDFKEGGDQHISTNILETKIREDLERMKKIRRHRGLRHHWLLKVRGQKTCSTGRRGVQIGIIRKKKE